MKKIIYGLIVVLLLTGCNAMYNTPTKQTEMMLANYQTLNKEVIDDLENVVDKEELFNTKQREEYIKLMKKHYKELTYDIKEEVINGDKATVTVEIAVKDYSKIMKDARKHLTQHKEEFNNSKGEYDDTKFTDYRLDKLKKTNETVKYTIDFKLTKQKKEWKLDNLTTEQEQKIHGMYEY